MKFRIMGIPDGLPGTIATVNKMVELVREYRTNPAIFLLARKIISGLDQKDFIGEAALIHAFVRDKIRYVLDVAGVETLQTPTNTIRLKAGDCDDKSTLVASLLMSIGHPCRFAIVGSAPGRYSHVYVEVKIRGKWYVVECTEPWDFGEQKIRLNNKRVFYV